MGHVLSGATSLPGLNIVLDLVKSRPLGPRSTSTKERGHPKAHRFTEDDFASGRAHQVFTSRALSRTYVRTQALVTNQEG